MISDSFRRSSISIDQSSADAQPLIASRSMRWFAEQTATLRFLAVPLVLFFSLAANGAEKDSAGSQLHAPTHRQVRVIEPQVDGKTLKLHTIATTADGQLLAAVGGQSMQYVMNDSGYEAKFVEEPGFLLLLDSEAQTLKKWELELTPSALAVAPDGTIYMGGSGKIAKMGEDGSVLLTVDSPHVGNVEELREKTVESIRESRSRSSEMFASQIETLRERIAKIESKDEDDRSRLEESQLNAFQTQMEMLEQLTGSQDDDDEEQEDPVDDSQLDMAVMRAMSVTSMAASDQDVFICATDPGQGGYSIWRLNRDLETESRELIMEGLRGCCGQMDIQCCGENLLVSENAKFRVGIYDRHGRSQGSFGRRDRSSRAGFGGCCNPMNSMAMEDGSILVAESSIGHVKRFDTDGNLVAYIGKASIGAGCKHCALGYDEKNDLYYMMYEDKNAICVLANNESTPLTLAEKQLQHRQADFLAKAAGQWSLKEDGAKKESSGLFALFGGGRGSSSQHPISSLKLSSDGNAKILEGIYQAYGDKSQLQLLDESDGDSDTVNFALAIDQVRFLEGTWKFDDQDTATLTFQGQSPITLVRESKAVESTRGGQDRTTETTANIAPGKTPRGAAGVLSRNDDAKTELGLEVHVANGQLWESIGDFDEALQSYTKALESEPNSAPALKSVARLCFRQSKHKQAAEFFRRAIAQSPEDAGLHNDLGLTLARLGDHAGATQSLETALELAPGTSRYANNLASIRFEAGDSSSAYQVLAKNSKPALAHFNMAYLYFKHGQTNEAKEHLSLALRFEPQASGDAAVRHAVERSRDMLAQIEAGEGPHIMEEAMSEGGMHGIYDVEAQFPKATFEYKVISKKQLGKKLQAKLNKLGAEGWEYCGRFGKELVFKRMGGFEMTEAPEE